MCECFISDAGPPVIPFRSKTCRMSRLSFGSLTLVLRQFCVRKLPHEACVASESCSHGNNGAHGLLMLCWV